ncbi:MAG: response regulator [Dehalococcoidales bacterium]|nr:response regulator [Dehalococcoidales bacterium]
MEARTNDTEIKKEKSRSLDWNSLLLLLLLIVPAGVMAIVLFLWPETEWIAEIPYTAIGILGSFTAILLSVFVIARYQDKPAVIYIGSGLMSMAVINGIQSVFSPESSQFVWLNSLAGICGSLLFSIYILARLRRLPSSATEIFSRNSKKILVLTAILSVGITASILGVNSSSIPILVAEGTFSDLAWIINGIPVALFMFSGISMFMLYRKTGSHEVFLFTAIVIFLFQASEVIYFTSQWSIIWWLWLSLRVLVYVAVLGYVLREHIQTSNSLAEEIIERKQVEIALREAEKDWRNSFNSLNEVMMIVDTNYCINNINKSGLDLFGVEKDDITGQNIYKMLHRNIITDDCPLKRTFISGNIEHTECYDDIFNAHFDITSYPIFNDEGEVAKCVYLMDNITQQVNAREKEKLLQKELNMTSRLASIGEVAAGITHEINNPLTSIIAFAQMLSIKEFSEDTREAIEVINDSATRIANIVDKLLAFARRHKPEKEYTDVNSVIQSVIGMRSYEMRNNNINLVTTLSTSLPYTMVNVGELQQVLLNIIINAEQAIKGANQKSGNIFVETTHSNECIFISIADDGPGISEEYQDKLFDPFFTTKVDSGGTGLGLSISYGIIKEHGGRILADSNFDEGATFIVELPIIVENRHQEESPVQVEVKIPVQKSKILVVDDELYICRALDKLLSNEGHDVETIRVAEKALLKIQNTSYDLVLLDIKMPGTDGIEFYHRMTEIKPEMRNKVICITGDIISTRNKEFLEETGIPYVTKPFGIDELVDQVKEVIGGTEEHAKIAYPRG